MWHGVGAWYRVIEVSRKPNLQTRCKDNPFRVIPKSFPLDFLKSLVRTSRVSSGYRIPYWLVGDPCYFLFFIFFLAGDRLKPLCNHNRQTIRNASRTILPDIFELPWKRSVKMIGTSTIFMPCRQSLWVISI